MILFILLQLFPLGLTGEKHSDPLYWTPGPRNIIILKQVCYADSTRVNKDTIKHIIRPFNIKKDETKK